MYTVSDFLERRVAVQCANVEEKKYLRSLIPDGWATSAFDDRDEFCFVCRPDFDRVLYFYEGSINYDGAKPTYGTLDVVSPYELHQDGYTTRFNKELFNQMLTTI